MNALLQAAFRRFRRLRAWGGCDLSHARLRVVPTLARRSRTTGRAYQDGEIVLFAGTDIHNALGALLHELAHLAVYATRGGRQTWRFHGRRYPWRSLYLAAASEVCGRPVRDVADYVSLDNSVIPAALRRAEKRRA